MSLDAVDYGFNKDTLKNFLETISSGSVKNMCTRARAVAEDATRILLELAGSDEIPSVLSQRVGVLVKLYQVRAELLAHSWLVTQG
jgi:hypothetical protein